MEELWKQESPFEPLPHAGCCSVLVARPTEEMASQDCGDGMLVSRGSKLIKMDTLNVCDFLYMKYTSVGLEKKRFLVWWTPHTSPLKL